MYDLRRLLRLANIYCDELTGRRLSEDIANIVFVELVEMQVGKQGVLILRGCCNSGRFSDEVVILRGATQQPVCLFYHYKSNL